MPDPIWPAAVPFLSLLAGYSEAPGDVGQRKIKMGNGREKRRNRMSKPVRLIMGGTGFMKATAFDAAFIPFYEDDLQFGLLPFRANDPRSDVVTVYHFTGAHYAQNWLRPDRLNLSLELMILP